jgi:hypothetical protein
MGTRTATRLADARCAFIARRQYGVISRAQAIAAGMTPTMIHDRLASKRWETLYPAIYRIAGAPPSPQQNAMAVCLWGGKGTVLGFRTAAAGWGLEGGRWIPPEIISQRRLAASDALVIVRRSTTLGQADITTLGALPISTATRTLIDMAGIVGGRTLEIALDQALRTGKTTVGKPRRSPSRAGALTALRSSKASESGCGQGSHRLMEAD